MSNNIGSQGAGVIQAVLGSEVYLKGVNLDNNIGLNGGCIIINEASLTMRLSLLRSNSATSTGGVIYSLDSDVDIDTSYFDGNAANKASFLYLIGYSGVTSFIGDCYISTNKATYNTLNIVDSQVDMDQTYFADNTSTGGSNGITAVGSIIKATGIQAVQTFVLTNEDVTVDSGFIMLSYTSTLELEESRIAQC
jgi:hypothetical protein